MTGYDPVRMMELEMQDRLNAARIELEQMRMQKDSAYTERNNLVCALCSVAQLLGWQCGKRLHEGPSEWDPQWRTVIVIDLPTGQASWHIHDSEFHMFAHLPPYPGSWDGHTTEEKYRRLLALADISKGEERSK